MANKDNAFGLRAIGKIGQNRDNQGLSEYSITANDTTTIFFRMQFLQQQPVQFTKLQLLKRL